jgi:hypothetical protein
MTGQTGAFRGFAQALSPEAQAQVDASTQAAAAATQAARQLTPEEQRMSDQAAREAFASRGMLNSRGSVAGEILGRSGVMAGKRQEADAARTGAFNMAQSFYTAPGLQALGNTPLSYQLGQEQLKLGLGAIGSATPQMINPDTGVNLGMQNRANQVAAAGANAQAQSTYASGLFQGIGSAVGGMAAAKSDIRTKENIRKVGSTDGGLPVYIYNYIGSNLTQMGVMAQDVEKVNPDAVTESNGIKAVYYSLINNMPYGNGQRLGETIDPRLCKPIIAALLMRLLLREILLLTLGSKLAVLLSNMVRMKRPLKSRLRWLNLSVMLSQSLLAWLIMLLLNFPIQTFRNVTV